MTRLPYTRAMRHAAALRKTRNQFILPKGLHRIRYYGLHATCKAKKVKGLLTALMVALGRLLRGTYRIAARTYRDRVLASTGRDPLRCARRGGGGGIRAVLRSRYRGVYVGTP